jgi:hypothetical protein
MSESCTCVKDSISNNLDLVLSTFANLPIQNEKEHLISLSDYINLKTHSPTLAVRYRKMVSERFSYRLEHSIDGYGEVL